MKVKIAYNLFHTGTGFWEETASEMVSVCSRSSNENGPDQGRQAATESWSCGAVCVTYDRNFSLVVVKENCFSAPKIIKYNFCETNSRIFTNF